MRWNLNEFLICNSSYIYNCAQDYREAAAFAFAKKPVLHEECAMLKFRICLFWLVWQNVHKGHWKDPFPLWLSFDVANLQHRRRRYIFAYIHIYIYRCARVHTNFTDCIHFIQKQQNCSQSLCNLLDSLKQTLVNIWICVKVQNKTAQAYK